MLTSSKKNETAVHGCNPTMSVVVVLVSHKVYFLCSTISLAVLFVISPSQPFLVSSRNAPPHPGGPNSEWDAHTWGGALRDDIENGCEGD